MKAAPASTGIIEVVGPRASVRFLEAEGFETLSIQPARGLLRGPLSRIFKGLQIQTLRGRVGIAGALADEAFARGESISLGRSVTAQLVARDVGYVVDDVAVQAATRRLANTLGVGAAGILSFGFQYVSDYGNPYLTGKQKLDRAFVSGGIGIGAALTGAAVGSYFGGPVGFGVGLILGFAGDLWLAPLVFEARGDVSQRNLAPLTP